MKTRKILWMLTAILICGTTTFTSCTNEDNPVNPVDNLSEKIIGKWITADVNGKDTPTNEKSVLTFVSTTKAYKSASILSNTWKSRACLTPEGKATLTPENFFVLTPVKS